MFEERSRRFETDYTKHQANSTNYRAYYNDHNRPHISQKDNSPKVWLGKADKRLKLGHVTGVT